MSLELRDVHVVYKRRGRLPVHAVAGVSLEVKPGQIVALVGESGSGKSSLGRVAVGLLSPTSGLALFNGKPLTPIGARSRPRDEVAVQMVFQNPFESLNPHRKLGSQIMDGLNSVVRASTDVRRARAAELLEHLGLPPSAMNSYAHQFSGGQRGRLAIARALAVRPDILVLDEPFASLDASGQAQLANLLKDLARADNVGMLLISHDLSVVRHIADVVAVMYLGVVVEFGPTKQLWQLPLHPYTDALIGAIPVPDGSGTFPKALAGEIGDPANPPIACRFHPRCPHVFGRCRIDTPALEEINPEHGVACWLHSSSRRGPLPNRDLANSDVITATKWIKEAN